MAYDNPKKKKGLSSPEFFGSSVFDVETPVHKLVAQAPGSTVRGETIIAAPKKKVAPKKLSMVELAKQQRAKKKTVETKTLESGGRTQTPELQRLRSHIQSANKRNAQKSTPESRAYIKKSREALAAYEKLHSSN